MSELVEYQDKTLAVLSGVLLNPQAKRKDRVAAWLVLLEAQAKELIKEEYEGSSFEDAGAQWKALTETELALDDPSNLDDNKRVWYYMYHSMLLDRIADLSSMVSQDAQGTVSRVIEEKRRKMLRWAEIENLDDAVAEIENTIDLDLSRSDQRQMAALLKRKDELENAGVDGETLLEVFSRKPRFASTAGQMVGRILKDNAIPEEEKPERIKNVMESAATAEKSTQITNGYGGVSAQYERINLPDGRIVLQVLCQDEHDYNTLFSKISGLLTDSMEPLPIVYQTQQQKGYQDALTAFTVALAIIESGDIDELSTVDSEIVKTLSRFGILEDVS